MMAESYKFPEGAIDDNRGLPPGTRITEVIGRPHLDRDDGQWQFTPESRAFEILSVGVDSYECRYHCCRIRAGPLVKECRALRPRFHPGETALDHRAKAEIKRYQRCAVNRKQVDRLEVRRSEEPTGTHYTLTYDNGHLPRDFGGVRRSLRAFLPRVIRWRNGEPLDYAYAIEGLHGDHRYHIHFACPYEDLSPEEIAKLWRQGTVDDEPVLKTHPVKDRGMMGV